MKEENGTVEKEERDKRNEQKERNEIRSKKNNSQRVWPIVSIA